MYEKGEFQCKKHVQAIQNHGSDSICTVCRYVLIRFVYSESAENFVSAYQVASYSPSSLLQCTWTIAIPQSHTYTQLNHSNMFYHFLAAPSHSPTYWFTGNNRMDRRWFGLPFPWWQVPSRGQQLWGQIWDLTWISWCGPWNILKYTRHESGFSLALSTTTWRIVMRTWCPRERYVS